MPLRTRRQLDLLHRIKARFRTLYGEDVAGDCIERLNLLIGRYEHHVDLPGEVRDDVETPRWTQATNILITYGDMVHTDAEPPLVTLHRFAKQHLADVFEIVHILPFYPYSSDDGFSVIDYRAVDQALGGWDHITSLDHDVDLMFDLVLNHCSKHSAWFRDYMHGVAPGKRYFIELEPGADLSQVTRPRQSPLLSPVQTRLGEKWVWTTFSDDQVDLNFANPDVLLEMFDILLLYISRGARVIRLDAIAYLWKQIGTTCIHLPQTHEVVKLMRDVVELFAPHVVLITETNVPHAENISYFGAGDEAHMVYNFTLPPLLLHAIQTGTAKHLTRWAKSLKPPPVGCTYFNFTASHDGVGVRPLEGILPKKEIRELCDRVKQLGGHVSEKSNPDGTKSPYELNITYFDAMGRAEGGSGGGSEGEGNGGGAEGSARGDEGLANNDDEMKIRRFLCSQTIPLTLMGVPAVYFHSLVATRNDVEGVDRLGYPRAINRHKWDAAALEARLTDESSTHARVFAEYRRRLQLRRGQPAFHPEAPQRVLSLSPSTFAVERTAIDGKQVILCLANLSETADTIDISTWLRRHRSKTYADLLSDEPTKRPGGEVKLEPYACVWLKPGA